MANRIGIGYDVHRLDEGLPLILGGVHINHTKGLVGHSDADVLLHAVCDALLGAASLGDIGQHFPDHSNEFKGIDSRILLQMSVSMIRDKGYRVVNVDAVLILQKPKVKEHIPEMCRIIAAVLGTPVEDVSVKATTTEYLGFEGREEGVAAQAVVLLEK